MTDDAGTAGDDDDDMDDAGTGGGETIACAEATCDVGDQACCSTPGGVTSIACIETGRLPG